MFLNTVVVATLLLTPFFIRKSIASSMNCMFRALLSAMMVSPSAAPVPSAIIWTVSSNAARGILSSSPTP